MKLQNLIKHGVMLSMVAGFGVSMVHAKDRQMVTVPYGTSAKQALPAGLRTVTVIDFGVTSTEPQAPLREAKWSALGADMMESMLRASGADGGPLVVVQRSQTRPALQQEVGGAYGLLPPDAVSKVCEILNLNGVVVGYVQVRIDDKNNRQRVNWDRVLGGVGGRPNEGPYEPRYQRDGDSDRHGAYARGSRRGSRQVNLSRDEIDEVNRALSVECTFQVLDAANGRTVAELATPPMRRSDRVSPNFNFGRYLPDSELNPIDYFIGELVERAAQDFVSSIVPTRVNITYQLVGDGKDFRRGLQYLRENDYRRAYDAFEDAHHDEDDDAYYPFAMGVTAELMGDLPRALDLYRRALASDDIDDDLLPQYREARDRLDAYLNGGRRNAGGMVEVRPVGPVQPYRPAPYNPPPPPPSQPPTGGQHAGRNCLTCGYGPMSYAVNRCPRCGRNPDAAPGQ